MAMLWWAHLLVQTTGCWAKVLPREDTTARPTISRKEECLRALLKTKRSRYWKRKQGSKGLICSIRTTTRHLPNLVCIGNSIVCRILVCLIKWCNSRLIACFFRHLLIIKRWTQFKCSKIIKMEEYYLNIKYSLQCLLINRIEYIFELGRQTF